MAPERSTEGDADNGNQRRGLPEERTALVSAVLAFALAVLFRAGSTDFCLDDAWIHLSYAKSLRLGDGFSYNPGDWETGSSSPLWAVLVAVWPIGSAPVWAAQLLGSLLHGVTAFLAARIAVDLGRQRATVARPVPLLSVGILAGVLVACSPQLLQGAGSGMEVPLASALILAATHSTLARHYRSALVLGLLAIWARPEALFWVAILGVWFAVDRRDPRALSPAVGGLAGLGAWMAWCFAISGHIWPNTRYVKASDGGWAGLAYVQDQVLPWEPWIVSVAGVVLIGMALRSEWKDGRRELSGLMVAWVVCIVAIALSRPLHPGVLFYERRYFAIVAAIPTIVLALALITTRKRLVVLLFGPVAILTGLQVRDARSQSRAQEDDVTRLHTRPAQYVAEHLPKDAVVAVEGAGALRYFTPRSMRIVDLMGLNDAGLAHAPSGAQRVCRLLERSPTHLVLPDNVVPKLRPVFDTTLLQAFEDPAYNQVEPSHPAHVFVLQIDGVSEKWAKRCAGSGEP